MVSVRNSGRSGTVAPISRSTAALAHGLPVTALARHPERVPILPGLTAVTADVHDPESIARAVLGCDVLLSGLGAVKGSSAGTLTPAPRRSPPPASHGSSGSAAMVEEAVRPRFPGRTVTVIGA